MTRQHHSWTVSKVGLCYTAYSILQSKRTKKFALDHARHGGPREKDQIKPQQVTTCRFFRDPQARQPVFYEEFFARLKYQGRGRMQGSSARARGKVEEKNRLRTLSALLYMYAYARISVIAYQRAKRQTPRAVSAGNEWLRNAASSNASPSTVIMLLGGGGML